MTYVDHEILTSLCKISAGTSHNNYFKKTSWIISKLPGKTKCSPTLMAAKHEKTRTGDVFDKGIIVVFQTLGFQCYGNCFKPGNALITPQVYTFFYRRLTMPTENQPIQTFHNTIKLGWQNAFKITDFLCPMESEDNRNCLFSGFDVFFINCLTLYVSLLTPLNITRLG